MARRRDGDRSCSGSGIGIPRAPTSLQVGTDQSSVHACRCTDREDYFAATASSQAQTIVHTAAHVRAYTPWHPKPTRLADTV